MSELNELQSQIEAIFTRAEKSLKEAPDSQKLYDVKVEFWGKSGELTGMMKKMGLLSPADKPVFGQIINKYKAQLEALFESQTEELKNRELTQKMQDEKLDMTLKVHPVKTSTLHPVQIVIQEMVQVLSRLGFAVRTGPLIEKDYYNFEALNIPANHPARDMQDTFFIDPTHVMRTHTSPIQIHTLENEKPPLRVVGIGPVFRCDSDISHLPHFHQIEGMCVDHKVSMADLKGTISFFVKEFFGPELKTRFRPSFFPFTEPSAEVDCTCPICKGKGCQMCKQSGWIEIGGCGLINPRVLQMAGVNYPDWQGYAFGFGIERMAIIKYGIEDIRLFPENDLRFLEQFKL